MNISHIDYKSTGAFSALVTDYLEQEPRLAPFYHRFPSLEAFGEQIREKQQGPDQRPVLVAELERQYAGMPGIHPEVVRNLQLLARPTTFTVTTGHQLNLFTGPLYFIYKILSTIKLARQLKAAYPGYDFVPVYWMATEDHDFAEVNHFSLFGQTHTWETDQQGAVGRFSTAGIGALLDQLPEIGEAYKDAYRRQPTLAGATRQLTHGLFGKYGLVNVDGDSVALKTLFKPVVMRELQQQQSHALVEATSGELAQHYKPQVMSREINLFYLDQGLRERIVPEGEGFKVLNTPLVFSREELLALADTQPEKFSPNVVLRPLYQEMVLPNLAYIGGGAEGAYWFQLKAVFEAWGLAYPIVMLRDSALYINRASANRIHKLQLQPADVFQDLAALKRQVVDRLETESLSLEVQQQAITAAYDQIAALATRIDPTLTKAVAAEAQRTHNALAVLEKKLVKANDTKYEVYFNQLGNLKDKLFPQGTLQERVENFFSLQANNPDLITQLLEGFDPLAAKFTLLIED
ncbi:MAG: bacillithiol biosynthesis cysteine-adding enzyme BshC [Adhaeribacter sp.]